jgi:hypothetical protein
MSNSVSVKSKQHVAERAGYKCEYCLLPEKVSFYTFHVDHIRSIKHFGSSHLKNLAYCCPECNHFKGSDIATFILDSDALIRFFNPRTDDWDEHFELIDGAIFGKTPIGIATENIFKFNDTDRLIFRRQLIMLSQYP